MSANPDVKDCALDLFHNGMKVIAEELDTSAHKALFIKFSNILENGDKHALIIATIKAGNSIYLI